MLGLSGNNPLLSVAWNALSLDRINDLYSTVAHLRTDEFLEEFFSTMNIDRRFDPMELDRIPDQGPVVIVSNHPFGAVDGLALLSLALKRRPDVCVMANGILSLVEPLSDVVISVDPFRRVSSQGANASGMRQCMRHLMQDGALIVFPAGEVSAPQGSKKEPRDKPWDVSVMKLIQRTRATVVPVFIPGRNSEIFYRVGKIHPRLRTAWLPRELLKRRNSSITVTVGRPVDRQILARLADPEELGRYLHAHVYALSGLSDRSHHQPLWPTSAQQDIVEAIDPRTVASELELHSSRRLLEQGGFELYLLPGDSSPAVLHEIGRLREITFRDVGEGTGSSIDIDSFDRHYEHLVLWHPESSMIVGAYRLGHGARCIQHNGVAGLYITTLFSIDKEGQTLLRSSLELGRSFVRKEFQRHRLPLFLLWRGILQYVSQNPEIRTIIGPVSISADYSDVSKILMIEFFQHQAQSSAFSGHVQPVRRFSSPSKASLDLKALLSPVGGDLRLLDRVIGQLEISLRSTPVLIRKYCAQNARIVAFNVDPNFSNTLDGFMVLDVSEIRGELEEMTNCSISRRQEPEPQRP
jgi:putative hemolysin